MHRASSDQWLTIQVTQRIVGNINSAVHIAICQSGTGTMVAHVTNRIDVKAKRGSKLGIFLPNSQPLGINEVKEINEV